jgi:hypothetical protein
MADQRSSEVVTLKDLRAGNTKMSKRHIWLVVAPAYQQPRERKWRNAADAGEVRRFLDVAFGRLTIQRCW